MSTKTHSTMYDIDNPDLEKQMQAEDYYLKPLMKRDNKISWLLANKKETEDKLIVTEDKLTKTKEQLDIEIEKSREKDKTLNETTKELNEKDKELDKTAKELNESREIIINFAKNLKAIGKSIDEIQTITKLSRNEINDL